MKKFQVKIKDVDYSKGRTIKHYSFGPRKARSKIKWGRGAGKSDVRIIFFMDFKAKGNKISAIRTIQKYFRGHLARKKLTKMKDMMHEVLKNTEMREKVRRKGKRKDKKLNTLYSSIRKFLDKKFNKGSESFYTIRTSKKNVKRSEKSNSKSIFSDGKRHLSGFERKKRYKNSKFRSFNRTQNFEEKSRKGKPRMSMKFDLKKNPMKSFIADFFRKLNPTSQKQTAVKKVENFKFHDLIKSIKNENFESFKKKNLHFTRKQVNLKDKVRILVNKL